MRTLEDGEGPSSGGHVGGHVGEIDCTAASYLLGLGPGADDRLGGYAGRGGDVVGLDAEAQAAAVGYHVVVEGLKASDFRVDC